MNDINFGQLAFQAGAVFTPGSPINERDLFSGRTKELKQILNAISQKGYHAALYGERGVGKTSLAKVLPEYLKELNQNAHFLNVTCDGADTFSSIWGKAFQDLLTSQVRPGIGFTAEEIVQTEKLLNLLPEKITPDIVKRVLKDLSHDKLLIVVFDEFDRLSEPQITTLMADTIKTLSDSGVRSTILLIGVADSVDDLFHDHNSIERALVQIPMPRMTSKEIREIVINGLKKLSMEIEEDAIDEISSLSQGLPYITHLLSLHSAKSALENRSLKILINHVQEGVKCALEQWDQTTKSTYYDAVKSAQPGNIYKEVLLACALTLVDDLGYFTAAAIREPLNIISEPKKYDIPNFAGHLKKFSESGRGNVIERIGETRKLRYRFTSPMLRPFIIMKGFTENLINKEKMKRIAEISKTELS